jgi:LuxR family maltose regulon positive regulatory protein
MMDGAFERNLPPRRAPAWMDCAMDSGWLNEYRSAYEAASASGDRPRALACVADLFERLFREAGAQALVDPWIDALDRELRDGYPDLPSAIESRLLAGGLAVLGRRPSHPVLPLWANRVMALLHGDSQADDAVRAARFGFEYALRAGNFRLVDEVIGLTKHRLGESTVTPAIRVAWIESEALRAWLALEHETAFGLVTTGLALAEGDGDRHGAHGLNEQGASAALSAGDLRRADAHLAAADRLTDPTRAQDVAHGHFLQGARALLGGDAERAAECMAACLAIDQETVPAYFRTLWQLGSAHVCIERGELRRAERTLADVLARTSGLYWRFLEFSALLHRAWLRLRQGRNDAAAVDLARALDAGVAAGFRNCDPWWNPAAMAEIMALARARGMHNDYVAELVAHRPLR